MWLQLILGIPLSILIAGLLHLRSRGNERALESVRAPRWGKVLNESCGERLAVSDAKLLEKVRAKFLECGVVHVRKLLPSSALQKMHKAFEFVNVEAMSFGELRGRRVQVIPPFKAPFNTTADLFGKRSIALDLVRAVLGQKIAFDLLAIVKAGTDASKIEVHQDTAVDGTAAFHIPLQPLSKDLAPLSFCAGTHLWKPTDVSHLFAASKAWATRPDNIGTDITAVAQQVLCDDGRQVDGSPLALGDVVLYDLRTYHWSDANVANVPRLALAVTFNMKGLSNVQGTAYERTAVAVKARKQCEAAFEVNIASAHDD